MEHICSSAIEGCGVCVCAYTGVLSSLKTDTNPVLPYSFLNLKKLNGTPLKFSVRYMKGSSQRAGNMSFLSFPVYTQISI